MLGAPLAAVGAMAVVSALRQPRAQKAAALTLAAVSALWLGISGVSANAARLSEREGLAQFAADAQTLMAQVPEDERDSFMAYRVEPKWYVAAKALPCMRFYFLQEILAQADPAVMDEIVDTFETDPPRWLVLFYNRTFSPPYDERVAQIFETEYERVDTAGAVSAAAFEGVNGVREKMLKTGMGCFVFASGVGVANTLLLPYARRAFRLPRLGNMGRLCRGASAVLPGRARRFRPGG